ncbi:S8 family serine peptidase [Mangrovimonas sp. YM274]|uniref:S8 family serine peptidase n=1 Tax=Mangrovimonas sp. YM274 TaxID=3070660 RepID=UPI0027DCCD70|nr:S8 family serine peptidase [Mangrovimonas sp. YM274]WMI69640.1 S8 family serine peptidase [Mangrovimonas sp. YM274]
MKKITIMLAMCLTINAMGQTKNQVSKYISDEDKANLTLLSERFQDEYEKSLKAALEKYPRIIEHDGKISYLQGLRMDGSPIYVTSYNAGAAETVQADDLYTGGALGLDLSGAGLNLGLWEGDAVRSNHQELTGRIDQQDFLIFFNSNDETNHATHVAGTMIASGVDPEAKGMAYGASIIAYDWDGDLPEMASEAASGMLLSNHSYGLNVFNDDDELVIPVYWFGKYDNKSKALDELLYEAPYYLPVLAAGNDRQLASAATNKGGFDMLQGFSNAKNAITVAAVNEVIDYTSEFSVQMSNFSNWGPTDDGRIKPDISAKGVSVKSSVSTANNAYAYMQGTSMATPSVTGTLALLQEHYNNVNDIYMKAATVKALMAHTALEAGFNDGPDYKYGWGLLNAKDAANCITNNGVSSIVAETELANDETYTTNVTAVGGEPLVVTISWTDPEGTVYTSSNPDDLEDNPIAILVNDLDVRVTNTDNTYLPWKLDPAFPNGGATKADNTVDNIEKIEVDNPSGEYTVTVSHKGTLEGDVQDFSIVITGIDATLGVDDNQAQNVAVWPNPAKDVINLKLTSVENNSNVSLYDIHGRMVYQSELKSSSLLHTINVKEFASGVYFLNVENGAQTFNKKIVIE